MDKNKKQKPSVPKQSSPKSRTHLPNHGIRKGSNQPTDPRKGALERAPETRDPRTQQEKDLHQDWREGRVKSSPGLEAFALELSRLRARRQKEREKKKKKAGTGNHPLNR